MWSNLCSNWYFNINGVHKSILSGGYLIRSYVGKFHQGDVHFGGTIEIQYAYRTPKEPSMCFSTAIYCQLWLTVKGTALMMIVGAWRCGLPPPTFLYCSLVYFTSQPFVLKGLIPYVSLCKCQIYRFPWRFLLFSYLY